MTKRIKLFSLTLFSLLFLVGCRQSTRASYNVSRAADEFGVVRRVTVLNMRSDEIVFEVVGNISIETSDATRLELIAKTDEDTYKKHFINMNEWNMYIVEDLFGADVSTFQYEVNYTPEMIIPIEVIGGD